MRNMESVLLSDVIQPQFLDVFDLMVSSLKPTTSFPVQDVKLLQENDQL